jgi:Folded gastrulation N-terminus
MRLLIILLFLLCHHRSYVLSLPVQSHALENVDDQFFWQQAWFSSNAQPSSPFASGDSKKITAKSIFITPNLVKQSQSPYCPPGYLIDDIGKCIQIFSVQKTSEELLASRLINLIPADDVNNFFDYDYDDEAESQSTSDEQLSNLPALVPILNENVNDDDGDESKSTAINTTLQYFQGENRTDSVEIGTTTLSSVDDNVMLTYEHANITEIPVESSSITQDTTKTASNDVDIYEQSSTTDAIISGSSDTFNFDSDNEFLMNDSLIIVDDRALNVDYGDLMIMTTEPDPTDYEVVSSKMSDDEKNSTKLSHQSNRQDQNIPSQDPGSQRDSQLQINNSAETSIKPPDFGTRSNYSTVLQTNEDEDLDKTFEYEINHNDDRQNENKFLYHLTEATLTTSKMPTLSSSMKLIVLPSSKPPRQRVRFPDEDLNTARQTPVSTSRPSSVFSWPREVITVPNNIHGSNGGGPDKSHITRFWNQQPLITDSYNSRGNSKNFRMNNIFSPFLSRKVQIVTPQIFNYRK